MLFKLFKFIFIPGINRFLSRTLRPVAFLIPERYQFPVKGVFSLKIDSKHKILLEGHYTSLLLRKLFWGGIQKYEYDSVRIFMEMVKKSKTFIDIGANVGYYSLVAGALNPKANIVAFEPFPDTYEVLKRNIKLNGFHNITAEKLALSEKEGEETFFYKISEDFPDEPYQLAGDNSLANYDRDEKRTIKVKITTLDDYAKKQNLPKVDLIKMDTETTEFFILKGARDILTNDRPVILSEVLKGFNEKELENYLKKLNYSFYLTQPEGLKKTASLLETNRDKAEFFFVPKEKESLIRAWEL